MGMIRGEGPRSSSPPPSLVAQVEAVGEQDPVGEPDGLPLDARGGPPLVEGEQAHGAQAVLAAGVADVLDAGAAEVPGLRPLRPRP